MSEVFLGEAVQLINAQLLRPISYNQGLAAVLAGKLPAARRKHRWAVALADIPAVVASLGANHPGRVRKAPK